MEFHEKLQVLRKETGLTQEELAEALYVSRAAVSKWESGRGYPSIDSLKAIAKYYSVSIDSLLSTEEVLTIAEEGVTQAKTSLCDLVFGCLDICFAFFFFLPLFGQPENRTVQSVALTALSALQPWLKYLYLSGIITMILIGITTLALQNSTHGLWVTLKSRLSLLWNLAVTFLFILSRQPYAAAFTLVFFLIKVLISQKAVIPNVSLT